ncbi:MAG: hypothetical protein JSV09_14505, partial [Thermoplasmata archaeon]
MRNKVISCVICVLVFVTILVIEVPKDVSAQVKEEWVARYDGPTNKIDSAMAIAVDLIGNVYITGSTDWTLYNFSTGDIATIKYDPSGNELWMARYDGPAHSEDRASAITLDSIGNVYVTGSSRESLDHPRNDYVTIKYSSLGNELWVARYNGTGYFDDSDDQALAIAVDLQGNVYITGKSREYHNDFATIKYDSSGNELWVARYNSPGNHNDVANEIALDSMGNVYVTGFSDSEDSDYDYMTIAYDTDGNKLWMAKYDGPVNGKDVSNAIA